MDSDCTKILRSAESEERLGHYEQSAVLYNKASLCFGMLGDHDRYEVTRRKSGELFWGLSEKAKEPIPAIKNGLIAYRIFSELRDPRAVDCAKMLLRTITGDKEHLLSDREVLKLSADFMIDQGYDSEATELYQSLAADLERQGNTQLSATLFSNAAECDERLKNFKAAAANNERAGKLFLSCGLYLEASQHLVKAFLQKVASGEGVPSPLTNHYDGNQMSQYDEIWHEQLINICNDLYHGDVVSAQSRWKSINFKFKPSFQTLVNSAIAETKKKLASH